MVIRNSNHSDKTLEKLNLQRLTASFTDVTVTVAERSFFLHKSLLAAHSSLFDSVLQGVSVCQTMPSINLDGIESNSFSIIIEYIYTSALDVTSANVDQLQVTAQFLRVQDVIDYCTEFKRKERENQSRLKRNNEVQCFITIPLEHDIDQNFRRTMEDQKFEDISKDIDSDVSGEMNRTEKQNANVSCYIDAGSKKMMIEVYGDRSENEEDDIQRRTEISEVENPVTNEATTTNSFRKRRGRRPQARITCDVCNKSFTRPKYEVHKRQHTGEKPFQCSTCNKRFVSIYNLKIHERIHSGERPYSCKFCHKTFADPSTIRKHLLWHTGVRNKQCDICGKYFFTKTQVREHQRSHTKEKPYSCRECGKSYSYRCDLKRHTREHTGDLIGPCKECGKFFNHRSNFLTHMKTHEQKKSRQTQLKLQEDAVVTSDGQMILGAKFCNGVLVLPTQSDTLDEGSDVTMQGVMATSQTEVTHQKIASTGIDDDEVEVTFNNGKLFVKNGSQNSDILEGGKIILEDDSLSGVTSSDGQNQIFSQQCTPDIDAGHVIMLVQQPQALDLPSVSMVTGKELGQSAEEDEIIVNNKDKTLVVVDGTI